jgi:hypothetical protein
MDVLGPQRITLQVKQKDGSNHYFAASLFDGYNKMVFHLASVHNKLSQ